MRLLSAGNYWQVFRGANVKTGRSEVYGKETDDKSLYRQKDSARTFYSKRQKRVWPKYFIQRV